MKCLKAIQARHSTRAFSSKPLSRETVERILEAGTKAPSAKNRQPWRFSVVADQALRARVADSMERRAIEMGYAAETDEEGDANLSGGNSSCLKGASSPDVTMIKARSLFASSRCVREAPCTVFVRHCLDEAWFDGNEQGWELEVRDIEAVDLLGIGACIENMALAATALGVDSLWNCDVLYAGPAISILLGDEGPFVAALVLGHAAESAGASRGLPIRSGRASVEEVTVWH